MGGMFYYGCVEMVVDGLWGIICKWFWDDFEVSVFCCFLGFNMGFFYYKNVDLCVDDYVLVYEFNMYCKGKENFLLDCLYEGWKWNFFKICELYDMDVIVYCYNISRLFILLLF